MQLYGFHVLFFVTPVLSANILAILPAVSPSHYIWSRSLPIELASRGHHVTVVSPTRQKENVSNLTEIFLEGSYEYATYDFDYHSENKYSVLQFVIEFYEWGEAACEYQFKTNGFKDLINLSKTETYDLILMETLVNECFYPLIPEFGSPPSIALSGFELQIWVSYMFGNPEPFAYVRNSNFPFTDNMSFKERLMNTLLNVYYMFYRNFIAMPRFQKIAEKYLGHPVPSVLDIERNFSLALANFIPGIDYTRPLLPSIIPVGGMHLKEPKTLRMDIKEHLDNATDGVIFFSLGSNLKSTSLSERAREALLGAFSLLPQKILWKWEGNRLPGKTDNILIEKWLPQTDILAHPNVKLFISHCGLMSTQETIYRGVPVVGIPFYADQRANLHKMKMYGIAEGLEYTALTVEGLLKTINQVLYSPSYTKNVKRLSSIFHDQPESPLERAVFWTEYVLRHNGALHLRHSALDLAWYQYFLLDVMAVLIIAITITMFSIHVIFRAVYMQYYNIFETQK